MPERESRHEQETLSEKLRCNLGRLAGKRPADVSNEAWESLDSGQKHMLRRLHKDGTKGVTRIRSAEAPGPVFRSPAE